jgi:ankyrin repeat protein
MLSDRGADIDAINLYNVTPLHITVESKKAEVVELLLTLQRGGTSTARSRKTSPVVEGRALLVVLNSLTHSTISRQHREKMLSGCFVRVHEGAGSLMVWETVPTN